MRARLAMLLLAVLALGLWLWLRNPAREAADGAPRAVRPEPAPESARLASESTGARAGEARQPAASEARFEPLPEDPTELVVHVVEQESRAPVPEAEVFALDVAGPEWLDPPVGEETLGWDPEREVRASGKRLALDARGDLHLPVPDGSIALVARKAGRFGCIVVESRSAPEETLPLVPSAPCSVRVRDPSGRAVPGVGVALTRGSGSPLWRGVTGDSGELAIPNLGWLVSQSGRDPESWCVALELPAMDAPQRWFARGDPLPERVEFEIEDARPLRIEVRAADGQPVAIGGRLCAGPLRSSGNFGRLHLPAAVASSAPIVRGVALLGRTEFGLILRADALLDGCVQLDENLRAPQLGEPQELVLRMREPMQVLELRLEDENGAPLASRELEWISFATRAGDVLQADQRISRVRSDEQGRLVLAVLRRDLQDGSEVGERSWRGFLRVRGARGLESAAIPISGAPAGARRDLGLVRLAPAVPLVRGHVRDEAGRPLAHVVVGIALVRRADGQEDVENLVGLEPYRAAETDAQGAYALFGTCTGGRARLELQRQGYTLPRGVPAPEFDCGSRADLDVVLVRSGTIQTRFRVASTFDRELDWLVEGTLTRVEHSRDGRWIQYELGPYAPGRYHVVLRHSEGVLVDAPGVIVRAGERTLDPRLVDVDAGALPDPGPVTQPEPEKPVELRVLDAAGRPIAEGMYTLDAGLGQYGGRWHGGRLQVRERGRLTLWSPGYRAWNGARPEESGDLRLEPSWRVAVSFEIPASVPRERCSLHVVPQIQMADWSHIDVGELLLPVDLDERGQASFEMPGECEMRFVLRVDVTDPSSSRYGQGSLELASATARVTPDVGTLKLQVPAEAWARLQELLR